MRKIKQLVAISLFILGVSGVTSASLNFGEFLTYYFNIVGQDVPQSYKYIDLKYRNIQKNNELYDALQKGVYLDYFPNSYINLPLEKEIKKSMAAALIEKNLGIIVSYKDNDSIDIDRLRNIMFQVKGIGNGSFGILKSYDIQDTIMRSVYQTLITEYLEKNKIKDDKLKYGAIKGMVQALGDKYTVYFPPSDGEKFKEDLEGEYEGIGAYVEMIELGAVTIISPIKGSPAEKAGLQPGDKITKVDGVQIADSMSLDDVLNMIKGPEGTKVVLTIKRLGEESEVNIYRGKINIENVEYEMWEDNICYIKINIFGYGVANNFHKALNYFTDKFCEKYVFDVRNNPGGSLEEVSEILNYFVTTGEPSVVIKDKSYTDIIVAKDVEHKKLLEEDIYILINKGTASASEIFAGTIKEYNSNVLLIGEKTFGKGSVQSLLKYKDGSMLKYTTAKWYTGKGEINVDMSGIYPDQEIIDLKSTPNDEIIEYIKR